jgi:CubicO group peptidase (beta-lactamase class C family)
MDGGAIVFAEGFGVRRKGGDDAVAPTTIFQAGSVSKPIASLTALRLVARGKLELDRDVNEMLSSWQVPASPLATGKPITLRRLLSHTAGLSVHGFLGYLGDAVVPDLIEVLDGVPPANSPPIVVELAPGSKYQYSGGGYTVAQQLMIDVTDETYPDLARSLVFEPLAMSRSTCEQPLPAALRADAASGHFFPPSVVPGEYPTHPEMCAAGLWTTPSDLLRFGLAVQRAVAGAKDAILPQELAQEMLTPPKDSQYALGLEVTSIAGQVAFGHDGSNQGFKAGLMFLRDSERGMALMTNGDGGGRMLQPAVDLVAEIFGWKPAVAAPATEK